MDREKMRQKFNVVVNNETSSPVGFSETLQYMSPLEKIKAIKKIAPDLAKTLGLDLGISSQMKIKEIKDLLDELHIEKVNAVDKESLLELLDKVGKNSYLDDVLIDIIKTRKEKIDKKEEVKKKQIEERKRQMEEERKRQMEEVKKKQMEEEKKRQMEEEKKRQEVKKRQEEKKRQIEEERKRLEEEKQRKLQQQKERIRDAYGKIWNIAYQNGQKYYWDETGKSTWTIPGQAPPPPPQNISISVSYTSPYERYHAEALRELNAIPLELRYGKNYNPSTFEDLPYSSWM